MSVAENTLLVPRTPGDMLLRFSLSRRRLLLGSGDVFILTIISMAFVWIESFFSGVAISGWGYAAWAAMIGVLWLLVARANDCYDLGTAAQPGRVTKEVVFSFGELAIVWIAIWFGLSLLMSFAMVPQAAMAIAGGLPALLAWRMLYAFTLTDPRFRRRVLIVGTDRAAATFIEAMRADPCRNYEILGCIDGDSHQVGSLFMGVPVLGTVGDAPRLVGRLKVDDLVITSPEHLGQPLLNTLVRCCDYGARVVSMPLLYEEYTGSVPVGHMGDSWWLVEALPIARVREQLLYDVIKRSVDLILALVGLVILLPFLPVVALIIYLDSPGPIFYRQTRVGRGGRLFRIIKFRSMIPDAEKDGRAVWARKNDSRITRFGRLMRRTRIDELPQLWNVLRGDMSFIGPRPERPEFVTRLKEEVPLYDLRHMVRPGLSGWAQVKYRYGNSVKDALIKLQYDLYYIKHRSLTLDLLIALRTVKVVLGMSGI